MLYAVIMRFDSLRVITAGLLAETHKQAHHGISFKIGRSTLADASKKRPEAIFEAVYCDLYATYCHVLSLARTITVWLRGLVMSKRRLEHRKISVRAILYCII